MKMKYWTSWPRRARGLTLVEVLAGTALLGTLLVAILVTKGRLAAQGRIAETRLAACAVLDSLLAEWWTDDDGVPAEQAGDVPGDARWRWRMRTRSDGPVELPDGEVVIVELFDVGTVDPEPAAAVELLLPSRQVEP